MKKSKTLPVTLILLASALAAADAAASLRVAPRDAAPFYLQEVAIENNTSWYDAETWLSGLKGEVNYSETEKRLYWRKGQVSSELGAAAPFAVRMGRVLMPADEPRMIGGRLSVSENFIKTNGNDFTGFEASVEVLAGLPTRRVAIDPAYGGDDGGPRTVDGIPVKKFILAFAKQLAEQLMRAGYDVRLTRTDDVPLTAARRAAIVNNWGADLFISIEASGDPRPHAKGFEVFHMTQVFSEADPAKWNMGQKNVFPRSRALAEELRKGLSTVPGTLDRGVRPVSSPLLAAVDCPGALVVLGNILSAQELELMTNDSSRRKIVDALVAAAGGFLSR